MKDCQRAVDYTLKKFFLPLVDGMQTEGWEFIAVCPDGGYVNGMRADGYRIEIIPIALGLWLLPSIHDQGQH